MTKSLVPVSGRLVAYRVLEIGPRYTDRDGRSIEHATPQDGSGAQLVVTFGDVPATLLHDLSNAAPLVDGAIGVAAQHHRLDEPDRDTSDLSVEQPGFIEPGATYLTIGYVRRAVVDGLAGRWALWVADTASTLDRLRSFAGEAAEALDQACARLVGAGTRIDKVVHATAKAYFEPDDDAHMPVFRSELRMTATGHASASGWDTLDCTPLFDVLNAAGSPRDSDRIAATPSWWYFQAMDEPDALRRFLFAHWGLEALAAKFCKVNRDRISGAIASDYGLPAKSLLWPTPDGSDRPARNIEFQFALMAWGLKGADAQADIDQFKRLADLRNRLSHGERVDHSSLPRHDGFLLLREYLSLVFGHDPDRPAR
ncbi:hypothetical protein [Cellulosimicrobium sp. Marseille-Q8652]